jgi:hypothetical protein
MIHQHQPDYYNAINQSNAQNSSTPFVEFILRVILEALTTDQVTDQVTGQVGRLIKALALNWLSAVEIMGKLDLKHRPTFRVNYLNPALASGLIEMTAPDSINSPTQKYRLTEKGKRLLKKKHDPLRLQNGYGLRYIRLALAFGHPSSGEHSLCGQKSGYLVPLR